MSRRFATKILLGIAAITPSLSHVVADDAAKPARVLMLTESAGFKHGSVSRQDGQLSPAERAITELGISSNLFRVDCTQDSAADFTKEKLQHYEIVLIYM